jgi:hypothetical protein
METNLFFGQPKPGVLVMWGSAAWAQTQLTPGVSVLAAPRSSNALASEGRRTCCDFARNETGQTPTGLQLHDVEGPRFFVDPRFF